ncbi:MAG TPA: methyltransferase domain-containing protein [Vicinamibacterales bacterium]|nr:methyltransferase domain-containing protein [Vicinamibacterales bacterium]
MVTACTIVARNYISHARVLARSFREHHPDGVFSVLLIDDENRRFDTAGEGFRVLRLADIDLEATEIGRLAAFYDVTELATAIKPRLLGRLLDEGAPDVIYLDPDIRLYGPLDACAPLARAHGVVLTPHMRAPMPRDGRRVDEFHILAAGVYNLGFIAVGSGAGGFLEWWWERTQREARIDPARMMFTDQRWVDFVPSFFDHVILKDPAYNVAYWNLHERELTWGGGQYLVDDRPLTFFHFSGFDSTRPYLLSKHQGDRPRILLSEHPALARICREYLVELEQSGVGRESAVPYGWHTLPSGLAFDRHMRRVYREALLAFDAGEGPEPPAPFAPSMEGRFIDWLNEPTAGGLRPSISRYLHAIYEDRPDLQTAFPHLAGPAGSRFLEWVRTDGTAQHAIPEALVPSAPPVSAETRPAFVTADRLVQGANIVGYFTAELGVGEAGRLLTGAVEAAGIPHATLIYDATPSRKGHRFAERGDQAAPYDVNVLCVNADQTSRFARDAGAAFFDGRYTVGYWFWELDRFPAVMHSAFEYVDEVWTASRFVARGIQAIGRRPVYTVPLPVPVPRCSPEVSRRSLRLPEGFLYLFVYDFFSVLERKNPVGLIRAFERAFRPGEGPVLVIKSINGDRKLTELEYVRAAAAGREDILVIDEYYPAEQKNSLLGLCDCYVSLHRSEGLGLTMAEAMALGKPVVATAYSGNLEFMTPENSYLVNYAEAPVPRGCDPYPQGVPWAEPSLEHAAELMRRVYEAPEEAVRRGARAREDVLTRHGAEASGRAVRERLDDIRERKARGMASTRRFAPEHGSTEAVGAETVASAELSVAASLLTPVTNVAPGRRFGAPLAALQRLLFRVLRPYWWQQRQLQQHLINAVSEVAREVEHERRFEAHQRAAGEAMWSAIHALEGAGGSFQSAASEHLKALTEQLASTTARTTDLSRRLYAVPFMADGDRFCYTEPGGRRILGYRNGRPPANGDGYAGFEDIFRGSEAFISDRLRPYVRVLHEHQRVVEIGCGRGELLDLLREAGVPAIGVDVDEGMVRRCRDKGHTVERGDGIRFLETQPDASVPAIFAAQVVEHLVFEDFLRFLRSSLAKLEPGGRLIFETVNPHALEAFKTFWTDLSHQRPIFPEVAVAWCWLLGFAEAYVLFPAGVGDLDQDRATTGEYAVVATKARPG